MARIKPNSILWHVSGAIGKQLIVKHLDGEPYLAANPGYDHKKRLTQNTKAWRAKFKEIAKWAKYIVEHPDGECYRLARTKRRTAYNFAFTDGCKPPKIVSIMTVGYKGQPGDVISVNAEDDFKVTAVRVQILNKNDEVIEEGDATLHHGNIWNYITTTNIKGEKIVARAFDLPGNEGTASCMVS